MIFVLRIETARHDDIFLKENHSNILHKITFIAVRIDWSRFLSVGSTVIPKNREHISVWMSLFYSWNLTVITPELFEIAFQIPLFHFTEWRHQNSWHFISLYTASILLCFHYTEFSMNLCWDLYQRCSLFIDPRWVWSWHWHSLAWANQMIKN